MSPKNVKRHQNYGNSYPYFWRDPYFGLQTKNMGHGHKNNFEYCDPYAKIWVTDTEIRATNITWPKYLGNVTLILGVTHNLGNNCINILSINIHYKSSTDLTGACPVSKSKGGGHLCDGPNVTLFIHIFSHIWRLWWKRCHIFHTYILIYKISHIFHHFSWVKFYV